MNIINESESEENQYCQFEIDCADMETGVIKNGAVVPWNDLISELQGSKINLKEGKNYKLEEKIATTDPFNPDECKGNLNDFPKDTTVSPRINTGQNDCYTYDHTFQSNLLHTGEYCQNGVNWLNTEECNPSSDDYPIENFNNLNDDENKPMGDKKIKLEKGKTKGTCYDRLDDKNKRNCNTNNNKIEGIKTITHATVQVSSENPTTFKCVGPEGSEMPCCNNAPDKDPTPPLYYVEGIGFTCSKDDQMLWYCTDPDNNKCTNIRKGTQPKKEDPNFPSSCAQEKGDGKTSNPKGELMGFTTQENCELKCFKIPKKNKDETKLSCLSGHLGFCGDISKVKEKRETTKDPEGVIPFIGEGQFCSCLGNEGVFNDKVPYGGCGFSYDQGYTYTWDSAIKCVNGTTPVIGKEEEGYSIIKCEQK
jgi:hypothetical protein